MRTFLSFTLSSRPEGFPGCFRISARRREARAGALAASIVRLGLAVRPRSPCIAGTERAAMAGVLKKTTGLVGLAVSENPREHLRILYTKILTVLNNIPRDAAYRKYTEKIVNERFDLVKSEPNVEKLESKINCGQIEEVILQAEKELSLAKKMAEWRPWEPLVEEPPADQWKWPI